MLEAWRRDYNETRPHSKLEWLTPKAYAQALTGHSGRSATLVDGCSDRPIANPANTSSDQPRTLVMAGWETRVTSLLSLSQHNTAAMTFAASLVGLVPPVPSPRAPSTQKPSCSALGLPSP
ncbi:integrase core domain-containing protein [Brevundimonas sp.]|uniref:integrase core domain-containing protein n=1 Tax=Brevundimonas sp. TaxID=1871086 RepID=UPI003917D277